MNSKVVIQIDLTNDLGTYDWLKALMQNPIYDDESVDESLMRESLFRELDKVKPKKISKNKRELTPEEDDIPW